MEGTTELAAALMRSPSPGAERGLRRLLRGWQTWGGGGSGHGVGAAVEAMGKAWGPLTQSPQRLRGLSFILDPSLQS